MRFICFAFCRSLGTVLPLFGRIVNSNVFLALKAAEERTSLQMPSVYVTIYKPYKTTILDLKWMAPNGSG